ncbi:hypothetical protein C8Q77DRAFT_1158523 [Trametes polyzona]|nr:hypothetical protein C8Q77DRAFT_1158523 [Trametes polyzona]
MVDLFNVWDIVIGVFSLGGTSLVAYLYHQLPSKKVNVLHAVLEKTHGLYTSSVEQGLLNPSAAAECEIKLSALRSCANEVILEAGRASSFTEDFANLLNGLTWRISSMCSNVREVGAEISATSLRERERLEAERRATEAIAQAPVPIVMSQSLPLGDSSSSSVSSNERIVLLPPGTTPHAAPHPTTLDPQGADSCIASQLPTDIHAGNARPPTRRRCSTPMSRVRTFMRFVRKARRRASLPKPSDSYPTSDTIGLTDLSTIELVDEPDEEWEDCLEHEAVVALA